MLWGGFAVPERLKEKSFLQLDGGRGKKGGGGYVGPTFLTALKIDAGAEDEVR